jgi:hypothetical protein
VNKVRMRNEHEKWDQIRQRWMNSNAVFDNKPHLADVRVTRGGQELSVSNQTTLLDRIRQLNQLNVRLGDCMMGTCTVGTRSTRVSKIKASRGSRSSSKCVDAYQRWWGEYRNPSRRSLGTPSRRRGQKGPSSRSGERQHRDGLTETNESTGGMCWHEHAGKLRAQRQQAPSWDRTKTGGGQAARWVPSW